jgi:hypothetical protein
MQIYYFIALLVSIVVTSWQSNRTKLLMLAYVLFFCLTNFFITSGIPITLGAVLFSVALAMLFRNPTFHGIGIVGFAALSVYVFFFQGNIADYSVWAWVIFVFQMVVVIFNLIMVFQPVKEHYRVKKHVPDHLIGTWITKGGGEEYGFETGTDNSIVAIQQVSPGNTKRYYLKFKDNKSGESNGFYGLENFVFSIRPNEFSDNFPQIVFFDQDKDIKAIFDIESLSEIDKRTELSIGRKNVFDDDRYEEHIGTIDMGNVKITGSYTFYREAHSH